MKTPSQSAPSEYAILSANLLLDGASIPAGTRILRDRIPAHVLAEFEVRPGAPRERRAGGGFAPGVSYKIDADGLPVRDEKTAAAEERAHAAWREREEENWSHVEQGLGPSEKTVAAWRLAEGGGNEG